MWIYVLPTRMRLTERDLLAAAAAAYPLSPKTLYGTTAIAFISIR